MNNDRETAPWVRDLSSKGRIRLVGVDRTRFLHGMVTADIESLAPGQGCQALLLTVKGKLVGRMVVYHETESLLLEVDAERTAQVASILQKHLLMDDAEVVDETATTREWGIYGEKAAEFLHGWLKESFTAQTPYEHRRVTVDGASVFVAVADDTLHPGFHVIGPTDLPFPAHRAISDELWERWRILAGVPRWNAELDDDRLALEAGFQDAISTDKGCYLGQEVIVRATARGHLNRQLKGLIIAGTSSPKVGARIFSHSTDVGALTSVTYLEQAKCAIGLGYVHRSAWDSPEALVVRDENGEFAAQLSDLPFDPPFLASA